MDSNDTTADPVRQYEDGEEVPFHEGDQYFFQCQASGGTLPPFFQLSIGDKDITDKFTTESSYELSDGERGLKTKL